VGALRLTAVLCALTALSNVGVADDGATRSLKSDERKRSMRTAMTDVDTTSGTSARLTQPASQRTRTLNNSNAQAAANAPQHHLLLAERRIGAKGDNARLADVFIYNYASESLLHRVVDTATDRIIYRGTSRGEQLPLTPDESERALNTLYADTAARAVIEAEFLRVTGSPLNNLDSVQHKAAVFIAGSSDSDAIQSCGSWRCAQILLYTATDHIAIDLRPIVRLATNQVIAVDMVQNAGHSH